jgi:pyruvate formate lyase activating enzyme
MGMITEIQRFSLKDGPGIRTCVFFKGCNIACRWCHNPETLSIKREVLRYPERCVHCGACVGFNGFKASKGLPPKSQDLTIEIAERCYAGALAIAGKKMSVDEVMYEINQDIDYYQTSGGGVTISGGEVCMQNDFAAEILIACKEKGISTAIETNLCYDYSLLKVLLPYLDLIMADIKIFDNDKHKEYTGSGNEQILANIKNLPATGKPFILRTPVVPGVNNNREEIISIAKYIADEASRGLMYYELLNFNPLGNSKYEGLEKKNCYHETRPLLVAELDKLAEAAQSAGILVRVG